MRAVAGIVIVIATAACGRIGFDGGAGGTPKTCREAKRAGAPTGIVTIDPDGDGQALPRDVWCDQDKRGGGWALALKIDGTQPTFAAASSLWDDVTLLNAGSLDPAAADEAKLSPYVDYRVAEVLVVVEGGGEVVVPVRGASLRELVASELTFAAGAESEWRAAFAPTSLESGCRRRGVNLIGDTTVVRFGVVAASDPLSCGAPASYVGIGANVRCPDGTLLTAGNAAPQASDAGIACSARRVQVYVRDDDQTHLAAADGCAQHRNKGRTENGIYLVGGTPRRCEMTIAGGGWTSALDFDALRDPCPAPWVPDPSGRPLCVVAPGETIAGVSVASPIGEYTEVMASVRAYQRSNADAFVAASIDEPYVDGLSITVDTPRQHIASFAAGYSDDVGCSGTAGCACPCRTGDPLPPFVPAAAMRCESGSLGHPTSNMVILPDPLFDDAEQAAGCEVEGSSAPVHTTLGVATSAPIEARLMRNEAAQGEGIAVYGLELWVR